MSYYNETPLLECCLNSKRASKPRFFLKYECLQPSGSFKSRGIGHYIDCAVKEEAKNGSSKIHVFSSSGGNAGLAAATAACALNLDCTVVVPISTKYHMVKKIENIGGRVIIHGEHWGLADLYLREKVMSNVPANVKALYVHPFDSPKIWEGHSIMVDEIVEQLSNQGHSIQDVRGIVCSVGGGGLYSGIVSGLERHRLADKIPIIAVETSGADVLHKSIKAGNPVILDKITSIASSLGSPYICQNSFEKAIMYDSRSLLVDDSAAVSACTAFLNDTNILVEPACAASVSVCYQPDILENILGVTLNKQDIIIVIVCGGSSITIEDLIQLQKHNDAK